MAKAKGSISKNPPTDAPDLELDEVLEQMLPHCEDDPFEVAKWADDRIRKKEGLILLADGASVSPKQYSAHLRMEAEIARNGKAALQVMELRPFGHTERAEAIVGHQVVKNELGELVTEPIKESYDRLVGPIKHWTVERKSFEANRPGAVRNRGSSVDRPIRAKPGPKPYDWDLYRAKFYLMLYDDDVPAHTDINASHYADRLMAWGHNNFGDKETPEQTAMREKVAGWKPLWERLKDVNE
jgi:hypothetical protein